MAPRIKSVNCLWLVGITLIFDGTPQIIGQRCQIAVPIWSNDISSAADKAIFKNINDFDDDIVEEKWPSYASGPKSASNSDSDWMRRLFNVSVRVFCDPNAKILLVHIPAKIKMSFI